MGDGVLIYFGYPLTGRPSQRRICDTLRSHNTALRIEPCRKRGLLRLGEGRVTGKAIDVSTRLFRRVMGTARRGHSGNRGPVVGEGSDLNVVDRLRPWRKSDRVV